MMWTGTDDLLIQKWAAGCLLVTLFLAPDALQSQERSLSSTAHGATAQERLLIEQIDQLVSSGEYDEAVASLDRLVANSDGHLIEMGSVQRASTLSLQLHVPVSQWAQWQLNSWNRTSPEKMAATARLQEQVAERAIAQAQKSLDSFELQKTVDRYPLAVSCVRARLMLCDLYLDQGWTFAARQALEAPGLSLRVPLQAQGDRVGSGGIGLALHTVWPLLRKLPSGTEDQPVADLFDRSLARLTTDSGIPVELLTAEITRRIVRIASMDSPRKEFDDTCEWAISFSSHFSQAAREKILSAVETARRWKTQRDDRDKQSNAHWPTFAGNSLRNGDCEQKASGSQFQELAGWPTWTRVLQRQTGSTDRNPASKPPVAENTLGLVSYHPAVHDERIYLHELTRILAFDLKSGKPWPPTDPEMPVFDSGMTSANFLPFGYSLMGGPRGTLTVDNGVLYARMGPPVTGWFGRAPGNSNSSLSYIVALELDRQGSMHHGFPVRLDGINYPSTEFEGCPAVCSDLLIVAAGMRDNVNLRRSVLAIERDSGVIRWRSPVLASGTVSGSEQASLISHQLVTCAGGRVFVNTNLGAIACIDQLGGQILWLARYRRSPPASERQYAQADRYRYRDLSPCMVVGTQLICAPQDCGEIFSLDAVTGELIWSTDFESVDDATQLLGCYDNSVVVAGDRIYWLDRITGRMLAAFPAGTTSEAAGALPSPRGYGRGLLCGNSVYWPTQHEIFVFDADQSGKSRDDNPLIRKRIRLDIRGAEGGNLLLLPNGIAIAGANRLFVFSDK